MIAYPLVLSVAFFLWLYWDTAASIVAIWRNSETFAHGFLILPISLWLIWRKREAFLSVPVQPSYWGVLALLLLGLGWLAADIVGIQVSKQFLMVSMVPALIWALQGWRRLKTIAFPVGFLLFAVPAGKALIPPLIDFTAAFTVAALRITGLAVHLEGNLLIVPSGSWSVESACSGIRYLIASVTLGFLYAYVVYRSFWRRTLFIAASVVVPIIANGFRAYLIVMIAHLSDMRLAVGVDHILYGWVFFGIVMALLFWLGSLWVDETKPTETAEQDAPSVSEPFPTRRFLGVGICALLAVSIWPMWTRIAEGREFDASPIRFTLPEKVGGWRVVGELLTSWRPHFVGADSEQALTYESELGRVGIYVAYYRSQKQGAEVVSFANVLVGEKDPWREVESKARTVFLGDRSVAVRQARLRSIRSALYVWHWYWIDGSYTTSPYVAKLLEARAKLFGRSAAGASIIVYQVYEGRGANEQSRLTRFLEDALPVIEARLDRASR